MAFCIGRPAGQTAQYCTGRSTECPAETQCLPSPYNGRRTAGNIGPKGNTGISPYAPRERTTVETSDS